MVGKSFGMSAWIFAMNGCSAARGVGDIFAGEGAGIGIDIDCANVRAGASVHKAMSERTVGRFIIASKSVTSIAAFVRDATNARKKFFSEFSALDERVERQSRGARSVGGPRRGDALAAGQQHLGIEHERQPQAACVSLGR